MASKAAFYFSVLFITFSIDGANHSAVDENALTGRPALQQWAEAGQLSDGDLVFRTGRDLMSRLVLSQGDAPRFSHVGIIVKIEGGMFVVHAIPGDAKFSGGVVIEPLSIFASRENASDIGFYRVKALKRCSRKEIREYVLQQIGKPFDYTFLLSESCRMYCTELVLKSFASAGIDVGATVPQIHVMLLTEPIVPPDYLRRSSLLEMLTPTDSVPVDDAVRLLGISPPGVRYAVQAGEAIAYENGYHLTQ